MDLRKLQSEVDPKRSLEVFEILRADTNLFADWTKFDIQKLCENIKILAYGRNANILRKNELIEYFAIVLGGKLLIKQGDKVIGHLGAGDVLGYMAYMDFAGTKASPFDVTGEIEGYMAVFRYDEFKMLNKREPELSFKITEMLAKKTLNTISLQYLGEEMYTPFKLKGSSAATNSKRVKDAMDTCPELSEFFAKFDQRDRKNLQKNLELIEFEREQRIVHEGKKADDLIILIKGELISFRENKPTVFYKPGAIIGRKEFLFGLTWQENVLGKAKGVLLKLSRQSYDEMVIGSNLSANNLLKALVWHECKDIKTRYQDRSMFERIKGQNVTNPLNEFVEYEITKHLDFINEQQAKSLNGKPAIKDFLMKKETLPLYMHSIHQSLLMGPGDGAEKTQKSSNATVAGCAFLREKLEKQIAELRSQKGKGKLMKPPTKLNADGKRVDERPADEEYEDMKNNHILLEGENDELRTKLNEMFEENKALRNEIRKIKELTVTASTRINKSIIHKELLSKDLINSDISSVLTRNYNQVSATFGDVLKEQHLVSTKARRVAKYAYKWLANVRAKKRMMMI